MKAITVKQPWATLIVEGIKDVENRTWSCPEKYIGQRILIHAGMGKTNELIDNYLNYEQRKSFREMFGFSGLDFIEPTGAIIGSVQVIDCVINHPSIWAEKSKSNCSEKCRNIKCEHFIEWGICSKTDFRSCMLIGESEEISEVPLNCPHKIKIKSIYNLVLANPTKFDTPIPCKGKLRFWEYEDKNINFK